MKIKDIGDLEELVEILVKSVSDNSMMEEVESYASLRSEWAAVMFGATDEKEESEKETNTNVVTFIFSYESISDIYKSMAKGHRLSYDGREYDILGYKEMERRDYIAFNCRYAA